MIVMGGKVIVYGGSGGLGVSVVDTFKAAGYWVLSVDIVEQPSADHNVVVSLDESWTGQEVQVTEGVGAALNGTKLGCLPHSRDVVCGSSHRACRSKCIHAVQGRVGSA